MGNARKHLGLQVLPVSGELEKCLKGVPCGLQLPVQGMQRAPENELVGGQHPLHRVAQHRDVGAALGQAFVDAVEQVPANHAQAAAALFRQSRQPGHGGANLIGITVKISRGSYCHSMIRLSVVPAVFGMWRKISAGPSVELFIV